MPVRLGDLNAQTEWVLERSGAQPPEFLPHVMLRARDVMAESFPVAHRRKPVREVGLTMAHDGLDLTPIVDDDGVLVGVLTMRALATQVHPRVAGAREPRRRRHHRRRDRRGAGRRAGGRGAPADRRPRSGSAARPPGRARRRSRPATWSWSGDRERRPAPRDRGRGRPCWSARTATGPRTRSSGWPPSAGTTVVVSPLDSFVSARMITLAAPCEALMESDPLTVSPDDLLADVADQVKDVHYGAAVVVDAERRPVGLVTRSDLVDPERAADPARGPRRAGPERARRRPGRTSSRSSTTTTSARSRRTCR